MDNNSIGERIRILRQHKNYSVNEFSYKVGISSKFLYEIEEGKKGFSSRVLLTIARELGVSCDYIMTGVVDTIAQKEEMLRIVSVFNDRQIECIISILRAVCEINKI